MEPSTYRDNIPGARQVDLPIPAPVGAVLTWPIQSSSLDPTIPTQALARVILSRKASLGRYIYESLRRFPALTPNIPSAGPIVVHELSRSLSFGRTSRRRPQQPAIKCCKTT